MTSAKPSLDASAMSNIPIANMIVAGGGFYPVEFPAEYWTDLATRRHHAVNMGAINDHIIRIEDLAGTVLWERKISKGTAA